MNAPKPLPPYLSQVLSSQNSQIGDSETAVLLAVHAIVKRARDQVLLVVAIATAVALAAVVFVDYQIPSGPTASEIAALKGLETTVARNQQDLKESIGQVVNGESSTQSAVTALANRPVTAPFVLPPGATITVPQSSPAPAATDQAK